MSMSTVWREDGKEKRVTAPLSLIVSAFAPSTDIRRTLTPQLRTDAGDTQLLLVDLGAGKSRLGGSALAQVFGKLGDVPPDLDDPARLKGFFAAVQELAANGKILAYHDRSDGGLFVTSVEMAFAGNTGLDIDISGLPGSEDALALLFSEELGAVLQVSTADIEYVRACFARNGLAEFVHRCGQLSAKNELAIRNGSHLLFTEKRTVLRGIWSETTLAMQTLRDDPACAAEEQESRCDESDPGLVMQPSFDPQSDVAAPFIARGARPRVAILREQGVNGQVEMAAAFQHAGFESVDVHMSDILAGRIELAGFRGVAACGGFSYGDVLGAGEGWAKSILYSPRARAEFERFFARKDTFTLGVCNGCQMVSNLKEIIPGAEAWPRFVRNRSEQFEARLAQVSIEPSPSVLLAGMAGSLLPIAVAHGEGRAEFQTPDNQANLDRSGLIAARFVDHHGRPTEHYPENPNGSARGITAITTPDGRATIIMPHPERVFRNVQLSWRPDQAGDDSPWMRLFRNARVFVE
jgi:phosphoribosylformylglycinamidine synthase